MYRLFKEELKQKKNEFVAQDKDVYEKLRKCWNIVEKQCHDANTFSTNNKSKVTPEKAGGWKTVRIFVSSTFTDFYNEREILVKQVFPELREWCEVRRIQLIDCDLRWGIPKDTTTGETIAVCLEELDMCHETNEGEPFFLNMMCDRYGWVPNDSDIPEEVKEKYDWVPNTSITFMEILHGAFRKGNQNAVFFIRDNDFLTNIPKDHQVRFKDSDLYSQEQLKLQKSKVREMFPNQVFDYDVKYNGLVENIGKQVVSVSGLETFATQVLEFFKSAISKKYPYTRQEQNESMEVLENDSQWAFISERAENVIGRLKDTEMLMKFLKNTNCDIEIKDSDKRASNIREATGWNKEESDNKLCIVEAKSGWGKTSLLAKITSLLVHEEADIFYHFCGSTNLSRQPDNLIQRLIYFLGQENKEVNNTDSVETGQEKKTENKGKDELKEPETNKRKITETIKRNKPETDRQEKTKSETDQQNEPETDQQNEPETDQQNEQTEQNAEKQTEQEERKWKDRLQEAFQNIRQSKRQIVLIFDAVNELTSMGLQDHLSWLPPFTPSNVRCIVTSNQHAPTLARLEEHPCYWYTLLPMDQSNLKEVAISYLGKYNKRLDSEQLDLLINETSADNPQWVRLMCEELRVYGDFGSLTKKIRELPKTLDGLFSTIFSRLLAEDSTDCIKKTLCLIAVSYNGLPLADILKILGDVVKGETILVPQLHWAQARRHLKPYIRTIGYPNDLLTFSHQSLWKAVDDILLKNRAELFKWHEALADYFQNVCENPQLRTQCIPYHLSRANLGKRMIEFLQKDPDGARISDYTRSNYLQKLRCPHSAYPNIASTKEAIFCAFCSFKRNSMKVGNVWPAKDCCIICGAHVFTQNNPIIGRMCSFHSSGLANASKCVMCSNIVWEKQASSINASKGKLCNPCGFGHYGTTCSVLNP